MKLPESINDAVESFAKLPGVGRKTALRQIMSMVNWDAQDLAQFADSIQGLKEIKKCGECGLYSDQDICDICSNENRREARFICVVENISDLIAIEKSEGFSGTYHVLGGVLNPLMGVGPKQLRIEKLVDRVNKFNVENLILAINPSVEGDATCSYIKQLLQGVHIERIGFGIPMGGSLEHLDPLTISKAMENRKQI
ncbi:MAG: recombination protein RecR [Halobacteriovoraceae bacterium]|nr:recombination protein RecR [Halobacteriovoraceae bacterium]|tara:strand:- start:987 stop:1577 length:591 start_codon:yes stop_codon:yes gene_type:complete